KRADPVQEVQEGAVPMKDVVIAERIEMAIALEAAGQSAEGRAALDHGDVEPSAPREAPGGGRAGKPAAQDDDATAGTWAAQGKPRILPSAGQEGLAKVRVAVCLS